jgi:hypothetical protein
MERQSNQFQQAISGGEERKKHLYREGESEASPPRPILYEQEKYERSAMDSQEMSATQEGEEGNQEPQEIEMSQSSFHTSFNHREANHFNNSIANVEGNGTKLVEMDEADPNEEGTSDSYQDEDTRQPQVDQDEFESDNIKEEEQDEEEEGDYFSDSSSSRENTVR